MTPTIVFAPDSFKGSAAAGEAAAALAAGWRRVRPDDSIVLAPMADGGEGTIDAFAAAVPGARRMPVTVTGPDDRPVAAEWLLLPDGTGVVELALASGITLLDPLRPETAHTRGFGQAIAAALDTGVTKLVLAIGGSSSTDAGAGALTELGARFVTPEGTAIADGNRGLLALAGADFSAARPLPRDGVVVLTDVTNPVLGDCGAAAVFGPQKGATPAGIATLEQGLRRFVEVATPAAAGVTAAAWPLSSDRPGGGAAGGTGYGLLLWGARLVAGGHEVAELIGLSETLQNASVVITGEGSFDGQSAAGKVPSCVLTAAAGLPVSVQLVAGIISADTTEFDCAVSLTELAGSGAEARSNAGHWLREAGSDLAGRYSRSLSESSRY
jgi:glycerate kinase